MSADAALLFCPVCDHTGVFPSVERLRDRLIDVSTKIIPCPVCQEEVLGLDKLTIHLFTHVRLPCSQNSYKPIENKSPDEPKCKLKLDIQAKKYKLPTKSKCVTEKLAVCDPVKYVKIYPKLPVVSDNFIESNDSKENNVIKTENVIIDKSTSTTTNNKEIPANTTCSICGLRFVDEQILKMHRGLIHNIEDITTPTLTRYNCHLCPKNFKMRGSLMVHLRVAHFGFSGLQTNSDQDKLPEGNDSERSTRPMPVFKCDNKQWHCDICQKYFTTKYFLKKHKRLHTGETPYACTQCNKTFTFQQSYHKHLLYHNDEKPHICSHCGRAFKELSTLHNHQRIHTGEKPFSCETCGKCFRQRVSYLVHRRIHTGVMPYKCTACQKSFRYKVSQRTHKCQSQPPGAVVRQNGELLAKLKQKHTEWTNHDEVEDESLNQGIPLDNAESLLSGAKLSLEDTEDDNFQLIPEEISLTKHKINDSTVQGLQPTESYEDELSALNDWISTIPIEENSVPSPSDILKKLCLSQDESQMQPSTNSSFFDSEENFHKFV